MRVVKIENGKRIFGRAYLTLAFWVKHEVMLCPDSMLVKWDNETQNRYFKDDKLNFSIVKMTAKELNTASAMLMTNLHDLIKEYSEEL